MDENNIAYKWANGMLEHAQAALRALPGSVETAKTHIGAVIGCCEAIMAATETEEDDD